MKQLFMMITAAAAMLLTGCAENASIGVIGGADGPTVTFVSAAPFWWAAPLLIVLAVLAAIVIVRRKKK